jgi:hypothetical protein
MTKVVYVCFTESNFATKTVFSWKLANQWKEETKGNYFKKEYIEINPDQKFIKEIGYKYRTFLNERGL